MTSLNKRLFSGALMASALALIAGGIAARAADPTSVTAAGVTLTSQSVVYPAGANLFPGGAAAQVVNANCLTCHSAGMVLNQPDLTRAAWQGEVMKMIKFYHAPINAADIPAIVDYLVKTKGKP
ncbi:MAG TPA: cytochrome c [Acidocella sp.]|jgi:cytochrome c5|nr:cytochrome c [Acidocella sp.]